EHGVFLTSKDLPALPDCDGWECPQLVRVGDDWVLLVSLWEPGKSPLERHHGVGYVVGSLSIGETGLPVFAARASGTLDLGTSFYAPQAVQASEPERVLVWGWAQETRPQEACDEAGWSGMLTFPRELRVNGDSVELAPARELEALRAEDVDPAALPDQSEVVLTGSGTAALRLGGDVLWEGEVAGEVRILIDGSIVEVHPAGDAPYTLRAYPTATQSYSVAASRGVAPTAWALTLPA